VSALWRPVAGAAVIAAGLAAACIAVVIVVLNVLAAAPGAAAHEYASYWNSVGQQVQAVQGKP
jgi:hypothetical protein